MVGYAVYEDPCLDSAEDPEQYKPSGFHPVVLDQLLDYGRYHIVHKLGAGGASTVWLARDRYFSPHTTAVGPLVCVKVVRADQDATKVAITESLATLRPELRQHLLTVDRIFVKEGPNGTHTCVLSEVAGQNLHALGDAPKRIRGNLRFRGEVARNVAGQVARFVQGMQSAGFVHGGTSYSEIPDRSLPLTTAVDLKSDNILLWLKGGTFCHWFNEQVYEVFGQP
jgi:serine/threonine-protein kinase SRPK3